MKHEVDKCFCRSGRDLYYSGDHVSILDSYWARVTKDSMLSLHRLVRV